MANKYRKKPVVIEATVWTGNNELELAEFMGEITVELSTSKLKIETLEGTMKADVGDYIIKGIDGEFYPCKPDIFLKTYDLVEGFRKPNQACDPLDSNSGTTNGCVNMNMGWISTKERMPKFGEEALVAIISKHRYGAGSRYVRRAEYTEADGWYLFDWPEGMEFCVTHWMPLPEVPPEEDCEADYKKLFMEASSEIFKLKAELHRQEWKIAYLESELEDALNDQEG